MRDKKAVQKFTTSYVDLTNLGNEQLFSLSTLYTFQIFCLQMLKFGGNLITVWVLQKKEKKKLCLQHFPKIVYIRAKNWIPLSVRDLFVAIFCLRMSPRIISCPWCKLHTIMFCVIIIIMIIFVGF